MDIPYQRVHAFTDRLSGGNPAGVCICPAFPDDGLMQRIATENAMSETAFVVPEGDVWLIRWFTPACEVDLCGHATLASAHALRERQLAGDGLTFRCGLGDLPISFDGAWIELDFPADPPTPVETPDWLPAALGCPIEACLSGRYDLLAICDAAAAVAACRPDMQALATLPRGLILSAAGDAGSDFVSRFFAPAAGIDEDPVTGSAHCTLAPYWAERLGRNTLQARQLSARGGELRCRLAGDRVRIAGQALTYQRGSLIV